MDVLGTRNHPEMLFLRVQDSLGDIWVIKPLGAKNCLVTFWGSGLEAVCASSGQRVQTVAVVVRQPVV